MCSHVDCGVGCGMGLLRIGVHWLLSVFPTILLAERTDAPAKASCLKSFPAPDLSDLQAPHGATWYDEDGGYRRSQGTMLGQCTTGKLLRLAGAQHRC